MKIFNVRARYNPGPSLWKTRSGIFQVLQFSDLGPIILGHDYTLIRREYVAAFRRLPNDQVKVTPAIITRKLTDEKWEGYFSLEIVNEISPFTLEDCKNSINSIWYFSGGIMVSSKLMRELQRKGNDLIFREDFDGYA